MTAFTMTALSSETEPHDQDTTTTEGFSVLSNLDLDDCCSLDPSLFANVTLGDLDAWWQKSGGDSACVLARKFNEGTAFSLALRAMAPHLDEAAPFLNSALIPIYFNQILAVAA
eukprot:15239327-Ditylum_brightwellii.AAC.1